MIKYGQIRWEVTICRDGKDTVIGPYYSRESADYWANYAIANGLTSTYTIRTRMDADSNNAERERS